MRRLLGAMVGVLVPAAFLAASSGALTQAPSGDTCTAIGGGTGYTVVITLPPNGVEQAGFAFGVNSANVRGLRIQGYPGSFSTQSLPANTSAMWRLTTPAVPGDSISAVVTTSGPISGSFRIVPVDKTGNTYFDPVVCSTPRGTSAPSNKFTPQRQFTYVAAKSAWRGFVTVPGRGWVIYNHRTLAAKGTPSPLIWSGKVATWRAGKIPVMLKPTPAGMAKLSATGAIKLNLTIEFSPKGGKPANKVLSLTLKK
jgi:hypothetical protein